MRDEYEGSLWIVFGVVIVFLLIATLNVCLLLIARGASARRSWRRGPRSARGGTLIRQLATEGRCWRSLEAPRRGTGLDRDAVCRLAISMPYFTVVLETATSVSSASSLQA